jgi:hypothetical protein
LLGILELLVIRIALLIMYQSLGVNRELLVDKVGDGSGTVEQFL